MRWTAPCGHPGTPIIGAYVNCNRKGCSGLLGDKCQRCGSDQIYDFEASHLPAGTKGCRDCGALRWSY